MSDSRHGRNSMKNYGSEKRASSDPAGYSIYVVSRRAPRCRIKWWCTMQTGQYVSESSLPVASLGSAQRRLCDLAVYKSQSNTHRLLPA